MTHRVLVIAEAGVNHNGSLDNALRLVDAAADAGADVVKFQTFVADRLATARAAKSRYQVDTTGESGGQLEMLRQLELSADDHIALVKQCQERGIRFMSTAFDEQSLELLAGLGMPAVKIPSGDITHAPMLLRVSRLGLPIIMSTGMSTLADIEAALGVLAFGMTNSGLPPDAQACEAARLSESGARQLIDRVTLLHCVTEYPAPADSVHLRAMATLSAAFGLRVGYSDHTLGQEVALAAVALGATVIEKHFTLDKQLPGPDHRASLEPHELCQLVSGIRNVERALGSAIKSPSAREMPNRAVARRSVVAARAITAGEAVTLDMLAFKRPASGMSPMAVWPLLGRPAGRDYLVDEPIDP